jgi:hypothetical protein
MHDKKSDHYTSAKNYTDLDGNTKSFDFVDHDVKTKIATFGGRKTDFQIEWDILTDYIKKSLGNPIIADYEREEGKQLKDFNLGQLRELSKRLGNELPGRSYTIQE